MLEFLVSDYIDFMFNNENNHSQRISDYEGSSIIEEI